MAEFPGRYRVFEVLADPGDMDPPGVQISINEEWPKTGFMYDTLTADEARQLAQELVAAAAQSDDDTLTWLPPDESSIRRFVAVFGKRCGAFFEGR